MGELKTKETENSVTEFIEAIEGEQKKRDAYQLVKLFKAATGYEPKMWGPSMIGFGRYHYRYTSGHEGNAPLASFSPRKSKISLYLDTEKEELLDKFGKHTKGKACVYINKVADIDVAVLKELVMHTVEKYQRLYPE